MIPPVVLDDPATWPQAVTDVLHCLPVALWDAGSMDEIQDRPRLRKAAKEIELLLAETGIVGFHCTKELATQRFLDTGLRLLKMETHHAEFLNIARDAGATDSMLAEIESKLSAFRIETSRWGAKRNGTLWFCLTRNLLGSGTECFFEYFGGEAVYVPLGLRSPANRNTEFAGLLRRIGRPVVVAVKLPTDRVKVFRPLAHSVIAAYGHTVNPAFMKVDAEGHIDSEIEPGAVLDVSPPP